jgi:hypothetical protein
MLGMCTNPSCSASFRSLKQGRLFRVENDPILGSCNVTTAEYWSTSGYAVAVRQR